MNVASVVVLGIVAGLLIISFICSRKKERNQYCGNCSECGISCTKYNK